MTRDVTFFLSNFIWPQAIFWVTSLILQPLRIALVSKSPALVFSQRDGPRNKKLRIDSVIADQLTQGLGNEAV
jgi:hypothetical protein